jgi:hypothetical protein
MQFKDINLKTGDAALPRKGTVALVLTVGIAILGAATPAHAGIMVQYTTTGYFGVDPSKTSVTVGTGANTATLSFAGLTNIQTVGPVPPPSNASYGSITETATGSGATFTADIPFTLIIHQIIPTIGTAQLGAKTLKGKLTNTSSGLKLVFTDTEADINFSKAGLSGTVFYSLDPTYRLVPPSTNHGVTSIQGGINAMINAVPEPATVALAVSGLPLLGLVAWRRRRRRTPS